MKLATIEKHQQLIEVVHLFIYLEIQHATIQQQNYKIHNTAYAYTDTKGRVSRHLHSTRKKRNKIHTSG